jgi:hypothetical protein
MAEMQQRMNETWANPEKVARVLREYATAFVSGTLFFLLFLFLSAGPPHGS